LRKRILRWSQQRHQLHRRKKKKKAAASAASKPGEEAADLPDSEAPPKKKKRKVQASAKEEPVPEAAQPEENDGARSRCQKKAAKKKKSKDGATAVADTKAPAAAPAADPAVAASVDRTIFIDGLPYVWTEVKVKEYFAECGTIEEVRAPVWQDSGRLRGFAHVTFKDPAAQKKALKLDGAKVGKQGRFLKIEAAKTPAAASGASLDLEGKRRLFVKNLPYDVTEFEVGDLFKERGHITEIRIPTNQEGDGKGFAYVEFAKSEALQAAFKKQPVELRGRILRLDVDTGSGPKAGFHASKEAYGSGYGPDSARKGRGKGKDDGKGKKGGFKGRGKGPNLSLF